jgi:hypothetical protein
MLADLDLLLVVYCAADDWLAKPAGNARRRVSDAEVVTLAVAQARAIAQRSPTRAGLP